MFRCVYISFVRDYKTRYRFAPLNHVTKSFTSVDAGWETELWQREKFYVNRC